jgi:hypothetical protein
MAQKYYDGFKNTKWPWVENLTRSSSRYLEQIRVLRDFGNSGMEVTAKVPTGASASDSLVRLWPCWDILYTSRPSTRSSLMSIGSARFLSIQIYAP